MVYVDIYDDYEDFSEDYRMRCQVRIKVRRAKGFLQSDKAYIETPDGERYGPYCSIEENVTKVDKNGCICRTFDIDDEGILEIPEKGYQPDVDDD